MDGFNSLFFKKAWRIVGHDIVDAVNEFLSDNIFFNPINVTAITLFLKVANASHVKDFSPISYCSIVYKIIVKILTFRLQKGGV